MCDVQAFGDKFIIIVSNEERAALLASAVQCKYRDTRRSPGDLVAAVLERIIDEELEDC